MFHDTSRDLLIGRQGGSEEKNQVGQIFPNDECQEHVAQEPLETYLDLTRS